MDILTNAWFIGIAGGIISGIVVYVITNLIFRKKNKKAYLQKIKVANTEIFYALRPLIVEKSIPCIDVLNSIKASTAQKYELKVADLYTKEQIVDDLVKEILDNPFLTADSKLAYCELASNIKTLGKKHINHTTDNIEQVNINSKSNDYKRMYRMMSLSLALATTLSVSVVTMDVFDTVGSFDLLTILAIVSVPIVFALIITLTKSSPSSKEEKGSNPTKGKE